MFIESYGARIMQRFLTRAGAHFRLLRPSIVDRALYKSAKFAAKLGVRTCLSRRLVGHIRSSPDKLDLICKQQ